MPELKGSQTHQNLKDAFAGESQANRRYLYYAKQADVEGYLKSLQTSGKPQKEKPDMLTVTSITSSRLEIPLTICPSVNPPTTSKPPLPVRPMNIRTCIPEWQKPPVKRDSAKLPTGSKPWQKQKNPIAGRFQQMLDSISRNIPLLKYGSPRFMIPVFI